MGAPAGGHRPRRRLLTLFTTASAATAGRKNHAVTGGATSLWLDFCALQLPCRHGDVTVVRPAGWQQYEG